MSSATLFSVAPDLLGDGRPVPYEVTELVDAISKARIGETFNQFSLAYPDGEGCRNRLMQYLAWRWEHADVVLVGEAAGYRGALLSGIAFTSVRQLGIGPTSEQSATIVHGALGLHDAERRVILWNAVPTHPFAPDLPGASNRAPTKREIAIGHEFLEPICSGRTVVAVGRVAQSTLGGDVKAVRHPARGGATAFRAGIAEILAGKRGR